MDGRAFDIADFFAVCGLVVGSTPREDVFRLQQDANNNRGPVFRLVDVDFAARLESSRATCLSKNYFSPLI